MNKTQKSAWYGVFLAAMLLLVPVGDILENILNPIVLRICGYTMACLLVLPIFFINRKRKSAEAETDERDIFIIKKALIISLVSICALLLVAYMVTLFVPGLTGSISVEVLQTLVFFSFIIFILILSAAILIQYGWKGKDHE